MFDIGFWEVTLIGVIALLVVGPERLPALARNVGLWVGRIRRYVAHVKQDIEREIHAEEMRELLNSPRELDELKSVATETASAVDELRRGLDDAARTAEEESASPAASPATASAAAPARPIAHHAVDDDPFASPAPTPARPAGEATQPIDNGAGEHEDTAKPTGPA